MEISETFKALYEGRINTKPFLEFRLERLGSLPKKICDAELGKHTKNLSCYV